jgi:hypothetical protein
VSEPEPMEQIDYGIGYKGRNSPHQHVSVKVDGGTIAIAISILSVGILIAACLFLPALTDAQIRATVAEQLRPMSAQVASAQDRAWLAERNEKINAEQMKIFAAELSAIKGKPVRLDGH